MHPTTTKALLSILNLGQIPLDLNHTFITLIPKIKQLCEVENYHPISLCNILYKLISKVIANRLKGVLFTLIFDSQSAFVHERQITDTIMAAYEIIQVFRTRKKGKKGFMSIKLDMSKAYCRVEWDYLERILLVRGFHS